MSVHPDQWQGSTRDIFDAAITTALNDEHIAITAAEAKYAADIAAAKAKYVTDVIAARECRRHMSLPQVPRRGKYTTTTP